MNNKIELTICMGSACHQSGVYDVLPQLQKLIHQYQLNEQVELKGAFCLGPCSEGIVVKFTDTVFLEINQENAEEKFVKEILPVIQSYLSNQEPPIEHE